MFCRALSVCHSAGLRGILDETYSTKKSVFCGETPLDKLNHTLSAAEFFKMDTEGGVQC